MGLAIMILGLALLLGGHVFITRREARAALIARIGEGAYKGLFSLVAVAGLVLIGYGFARYRAAGYIPLWDPPAWTRHVNNALMWPAVVCIVATYIPGNIKRILRHPMLVGVKLWAVAHLIANGDLGSVVLFGSVLAWAVYDRITLKYRSDPAAPGFPTGGRGNDVIAVVVGTLLYVALGFLFHPYVIGLPAFAGR
jgi:uncharacterized membrane protein